MEMRCATATRADPEEASRRSGKRRSRDVACRIRIVGGMALEGRVALTNGAGRGGGTRTRRHGYGENVCRPPETSQTPPIVMGSYVRYGTTHPKQETTS